MNAQTTELVSAVESFMDFADAALSGTIHDDNFHHYLSLVREKIDGVKNAPKPTVTPDRPDDPDCTDYTLNGDAVWLLVHDNASVRVYHDDDGVTAEIYPRGQADRNPIAECFADHWDLRSNMETLSE